MCMVIVCVVANAAEKSSIHTFSHNDQHFPHVIIRRELPHADHHVFKHYRWSLIEEGNDVGKWKGILKPESVLNFTV